MKVLTLDNTIFDINSIGNELTEDVRYWVLEYSNNDNTDYFCKPLLFLESFNDIRLELKIGEHRLCLPKDWSILCADREMGSAEVMQPKMPGFNEKDFTAFSFNPMTGYMADYLKIEVLSPLPETKWVLPKLKYGQFLCIPLTDSNNPPCIFITHQKNNKMPEIINLDFILQ